MSGDLARNRRKPLPPHWYKNFITECPVCGAGEHRRERQLGDAPPKDSTERWDYDGRAYDWCLER